jgi:preprotein translocase subunit SecB
MKPIIKMYLDTRRSKKNSENYPLKLRVTLAKEQKYYPMNIDMTKDEFFIVRNPDNVSKNTPLSIN